MLTGGIPTTTITIAQPTAQTGPWHPGQVLQGTVQSTENGLTLLVAGQHVPLPSGAAWLPGQPVTVEVAASQQGLQLQLTPQASPQAASLPPTDSIIAAVLESLGGAINAAASSELLPPELAQSANGIRALLGQFVQNEGLGGRLQQVAIIVEQAVAAGVLSASDAEAFALLSGDQAKPSAFLPVLRQLSNAGGHALEARIATALAAGNLDDIVDSLRTDVRGNLARLRNTPAFQEWLRSTGQAKSFNTAAERLVERLSGMHLQNLRGIEHPYAFLELPIDPQSGMHRAQIHLFNEGKGRGRSFENKTTLVAFDLSTSHLGDLWITLQILHHRCVCRLRATSQPAVEALSNAADELIEHLDQVGHPGAHVEATLWDGDRLRETAALMRRFSGINVQA